MSTDTPTEIEIRFGFDPFQSEALKQIVSDPVAFSLWAMWKRNHIVSDRFIAEVLHVAAVVRARNLGTAESVAVCFPAQAHDFTPADIKAFIPEWIEVLSGAKNLYMIINGDRYHCPIDSAAVTQ